MDTSGSELHPVQQLADEFLERQRRGESPTLEEYAERHPELADEIREVFPALMMIDQIAPAIDDLEESRDTHKQPEAIRQKQIGDYRILREIGRGGMGVVYEAEQESLRRRVALKVLAGEISASARSMARFQREARAAARMHHTNIVPVFEVGQHEETAYYAMQLIQGQGLDLVIDDLRRLRREHSSQSGVKPQPDAAHRSIAASLLSGHFHQERLAVETGPSGRPATPDPDYTETAQHSRISTVTAALPGESDISTAETHRSSFHRSVAQIGMQTADALAYAHTRGIIHRDIKPSNLILDAGGVVWVTDFGLAKTDDEAMTHTGDILGTMRYMSPERFRGQCDVRADVYSLGLTLYELLVLSPAFESPDRLKLIEMVRQSEPVPPRSIDPRIPRDLETIVLKSIDKDPKGRYQSADELHEDLRRFVDDEPIKARRISLPERLLRWSRRNKGVAASLSATGLLLLTTAVVASIAATHFRALEQEQRELAEQNGRLLASEREARLDAERKTRELAATALAAESRAFQTEVPVRSALLATQAVEMTRRHDGKILPVAHEALLSTTANLGGMPLVHHEEGRMYDVPISPDCRWLVTAGGGPSGELHVFDLTADDPASTSRELKGHQRRIWSAAISHDGRLLVTGSVDETARVWDLTAQDPSSSPIVLDGHEKGIWQVAISRNKRWVATASRDYTARVWDLWAPSVAASSVVLSHDHEVHAVAFFPDRPWLVTGSSDGKIRFWSLPPENRATPVVVRDDHGGAVRAAIISSNGRWLATDGNGKVLLWDFRADDPFAAPHQLAGFLGAFSPDGRLLATGGVGNKVQVWDLNDEDPASSPMVLNGTAPAGRAMAFSPPDNHWLVTPSEDRTARLWDLTAEDPDSLSLVLRGHDNIIVAASINSNQQLVTGSYDGTARLWDLTKENPASELVLRRHQADVRFVARTVDDRWLVTASADGEIWLNELEATRRDPIVSARRLRGQASELTSLVLSSKSSWLATGGSDGQARLWDTDRPEAEPLVLPGHNRPIVSLAIGPYGRWLVTGDDDQRAVLWDLQAAEATSSGRELPHYSHAQTPRSRVAIGPHGKWLATAERTLHQDQEHSDTVWLWDLEASDPTSAPQKLEEFEREVPSLAFSRDGQWLAAGCYDNKIRLWDLDADKIAASCRTLSGGGRINLEFGPNSRWLVGCNWGFPAYALDLDAENVESSSFELAGKVESLTIDPDGHWVATGSEDGTVRVWDLTAQDPAASSLILRGHQSRVNAIAFSEDSRWLFTGSNDKTVRLWDLDVDALIERARRLAGRELTTEEKEQYGLDEL